MLVRFRADAALRQQQDDPISTALLNDRLNSRRCIMSSQPLRRLGMLFLIFLSSSWLNAQTWVEVTTRPEGLRGNLGVALLLTDGTLLVQENKTPNWWILTPDDTAHYNTGTWSSRPVPFPFAYGPKFFASAVLPDGRVIVEGGEYDYGAAPPPLVIKDTPTGAIYNPVTKTWEQVLPPIWPTTGLPWNKIGDAPSVVLPDGIFMLGSIQQRKGALLNPNTLTWTIANFSGKADNNGEEGWTLLPDGTVLTVDVYNQSGTGTNSETYDYLTDKWTTAGTTVSQLWSSASLCGGAGTKEIGPAVLRPNGTVFASGANFCGGPGKIAIYDTTTKTWTPGPLIPHGITGTADDVADGPASILPDGSVLVDASPRYGTAPSTFWEFGLDDKWHSIPQPPFNTPSPNPYSTEGGRMLVLGSGNVLYVQVGHDTMYVYTREWRYPDSWRPTICSGCYPSVVHVGRTYTVSGTQFNGLSQGAAYGDDAQSATNFPLVLITNTASGHRLYARTHDFHPNGVATGDIPTRTMVDITPNIEAGPSTMVVVANGIPSLPVDLLVCSGNQQAGCGN
jgi:hypothetical protein